MQFPTDEECLSRTTLNRQSNDGGRLGITDVACHRDIASKTVARSSNYNSSITLHRNAKCAIQWRTEIRYQLPIPVERHIEASIRVVSRHGEIVATIRPPSDDNLAITLQCHALTAILRPTEIRSQRPVAVKRIVRRSIGVVSGQREIPVAGTGNENLSIRLQCQAVAEIATRAEVRRLLTVRIKFCVQRSIGVVSD